MVEITQPEEARRHAEQDVHRRDPERHQQPAQKAGALRILEQQRIERALNQHDEHEDGDCLLDILLDVRRTLADRVAMALLESLQLDDRGGVELLRIIRIVGLVVPVFVLLRLDRFAQLVGVNVRRRRVVDIVAHRGGRGRHPGRQAPAHFLGPLGNQLLALAPLVLCDRFGDRNGVLGIAPRLLARNAPAEAQLALGALAFQSVSGQFVADIQRLDLFRASDVRAPAHSLLRHCQSSCKIPEPPIRPN